MAERLQNNNARLADEVMACIIAQMREEEELSQMSTSFIEGEDDSPRSSFHNFHNGSNGDDLDTPMSHDSYAQTFFNEDTGSVNSDEREE